MSKFFKTTCAAFLGTLVALCVVVFIFFSIIGSLSSSLTSQESPKVSVAPNSVLKIDFAEMISEQDSENPLAMFTSPGSSGKSIGILKVIKSLEIAATDPSIKFVYMNCDNVNIESISTLEELRAALVRFQSSGKAIIAYANNYSSPGYYLASVADKVIMNEYGSSTILGLGTNMVFLKDFLDKLGVEVQLIRHGKYKSAGEMYINNNISPANREQNQEMIDAIWETWSSEIAQSREISVEDFNKWVDNLEIEDAEDMKEYNLVDELMQQNEVEDYICTLADASKIEDVKMVSLSNYASAKIKQNFKVKDKIAILYANGEIVMGNDSENISSARYAKMISDIRKDSTIKAVLFRVNSPGGSAHAAEIIRNELTLLNEVKPIIVSYGGYAASGGYWISAGCDKIFTNNTTLTGSIGVFSMIPNTQKIMKNKLGINSVSIKSNKHADMMGMSRPLDNAEVAYMQSQVEKIYTDFTQIVADGRGMSVERVDELAQGRVWAGADALQNGLADERGGIYEALNYTANVAALTDYRIVEYPTPKSQMEKLMEGLSGSSNNNVQGPVSIFKETYERMLLNKETGVMARVPYIYLF